MMCQKRVLWNWTINGWVIFVSANRTL